MNGIKAAAEKEKQKCGLVKANVIVCFLHNLNYLMVASDKKKFL